MLLPAPFFSILSSIFFKSDIAVSLCILNCFSIVKDFMALLFFKYSNIHSILTDFDFFILSFASDLLRICFGFASDFFISHFILNPIY